MSDNGRLLTLNGGSSSIRFALFERRAGAVARTLHGKIERIGLPDTQLRYRSAPGEQPEYVDVPASDHRSAVAVLIDWLEARDVFDDLQAVGHRIVHGMRHTESAPLTPTLVAELGRIAPCVPEHLPREIELIEALTAHRPRLLQVACFDTAFHRRMPAVARLLPIPRRYAERGIQRYGFHGLSYAYLLEQMTRLGDPTAERGRVVLAHLGNGASMAAVRDGVSIDTTMGFTPTAGLPMSTRSGDMDPGVLSYLARTENLQTEDFDRMLNHESGLLGLSRVSSDVRDLLSLEDHDPHAAEAVALFCYQARKHVGALAASLGGLDTLVFAGGIGENSAVIRERICQGLDFLGVTLDAARNAEHASVISTGAGATVRVIPTDEEIMIARSTARIFDRLATQEP